jgi:hypothetical protein
MLEGATAISAGNVHRRFPAQAFATLQEGVEFTIENDGDASARIVKVRAPPQPIGRPLTGFRGGIDVAESAKTQAVALPEQKAAYLLRWRPCRQIGARSFIQTNR